MKVAKAEKNSRLLSTYCTPPWAGHQHIVLLIPHGNLWQPSPSLVCWWETEAQRGFANEYGLITQPWRFLSPGKSQCPKIFTTKQFCGEIVLRSQGPSSEMGVTVQMLQHFLEGALCPDTVLRPQPTDCSSKPRGTQGRMEQAAGPLFLKGSEFVSYELCGWDWKEGIQISLPHHLSPDPFLPNPPRLDLPLQGRHLCEQL